MSFNFQACDRSQRFLLPVDMRDWLPEDHLAFFVLETVENLDLGAFYASYRSDGWGRAAFDPKMMVALVLYAFCVGERSSRRIERACVEDVGFRVIAATHTPDHSTIARFIARHHEALQELLGQTVGVCVAAGLVRTGVVAVDGTKLGANASERNNLTEEQLTEYARRVLDEAAAVDAEEDRLYGERRGDEMPEFLRDPSNRREWIREQLAEVQRKRDADAANPRVQVDRRRRTVRVNTTDPDSRVMKTQKGFLQGFNAQAVATEDHIVIAATVSNANDDTGHFRPLVNEAQATLRTAGAAPIGTALADAGYFSVDNMITSLGCDTLIAPVSARRLTGAIDAAPAIDVAGVDLSRPDRTERWAETTAEDDHRCAVLQRSLAGAITVTEAARLLGLSVPHASALRSRLRDHGPDTIRRRRLPSDGPKGPSATEFALARLCHPRARAIYARRSAIIEPIFGQIKEARYFRKFVRRGLRACHTEWTLMLATHNLRKAWAKSSHLGGPGSSRTPLIQWPLAVVI